MFRAAFRPLSRSLRAAAVRPVATPAPFAPALIRPQWQRGYADSAGLPRQDIESRITEVVKSFEKVDPAKVRLRLAMSVSRKSRRSPTLASFVCVQVTPTSSFTDDLNLDSLDAVEVVMAIEEEFSIGAFPVLARCDDLSDLDHTVVQQRFRTTRPSEGFWATQVDQASLTDYAPPFSFSRITTVGQAIDYIAKTPEGKQSGHCSCVSDFAPPPILTLNPPTAL
jgi:NADH dehydrogenase (ubiquinone) 1 alpha/beta subcomplex 1